jgi:GTP-binding protein
VLLHLVDMAPWDETTPAQAAVTAVRELTRFSQTLAQQPRWLVLNKLDMLPEEEQDAACQAVIDALGWEGPVYRVSALNKTGLMPLVHDLQEFLDRRAEAIAENPELLEDERRTRALIDEEARENLQRLRAEMRARREAEDDLDDDDFDDDDYDIEVEYVR